MAGRSLREALQTVGVAASPEGALPSREDLDIVRQLVAHGFLLPASEIE